MKGSFSGQPISGTLSSTPSKSHTHRAFFLSALAKGESVVSNCLFSADTESTLDVIRSMGAKADIEEGNVVIKGRELHAPKNTVDVKNSGTTLRIFAGLASMFDEKIVITGDETIVKRPMKPLLDALSEMGVSCSSDNGRPPVEIKGRNKGGKVTVDGGISSQFITSLLMMSPVLSDDTEITVTGNIVSRPYLDITVHMMKLFGTEVKEEGQKFKIRGGTGYKPCRYRVPGDYSSAAYPLVAGAMGGTVSVGGLDANDPQGDKIITDILKNAGASVTVAGDTVSVRSNALCAADIDVGKCPDLFPILAVLMSVAEGESRLYGAPHLKFKESDRIQTTVDMLKAIGADIEATDDGCIIKGRKKLNGGTVNNRGDHRIMMAAAVASISCTGPVIMDNLECCSVSYPGFIEDMQKIGMRFEGL